MTVKVLNLETGVEHHYSKKTSPYDAVKASYAIASGLATQWAVTLGKLDLVVLEGKHALPCGDWTVRKGVTNEVQ